MSKRLQSVLWCAKCRLHAKAAPIPPPVSTKAKCPFGSSLRGARTAFTSPTVEDFLQSTASFEDAHRPKPFSSVPGPKDSFLVQAFKFLPFIGQFDLRRMNDYMLHLYRQHGPLVRTDLPGGIPCLQVFDPRDFETILRNEGPYPTRPLIFSLKVFRESRPDLYNNVGMSLMNGKEWHRIRSKYQHSMMLPSCVESYIPSTQTVADDFVERIRQKPSIADLSPEIYKWALESIGLVVFNRRLGCLQPDLPASSPQSRLLASVSGFLSALNKLEFGLRLWRYFPTPAYRQLAKGQEYITRTANRYLEETVQELKNKRPGSAEELTLMERWLLRDDVDPNELSLLVSDIICAGVDTTSHTIAMTLYHLASSPGVQTRLYKEVKSVLSDPNAPITPDLLQKLPYLKACIKETMRLTPVVMGLARILEKDVTLSGYQVPKGVLLLLRTQAACGLEVNFPDAATYRPDRWLRQPGSRQSHHPYVFLPFGGGLRMCIGRRFAEQEMHVLLAKLVQNLRFAYDGEPIGQHSAIMNRPDRPLNVQFHRR